MTRNSNLHLVNMMNQAEQELAAFLRATAEVLGQGALSRAGGIWIDELKGLQWRDNSVEKFFRKVTIRAAAQLVENLKAGVSQEEDAKAVFEGRRSAKGEG
jgi:hypothetical protein